jgi:3-keto-5-aminohexanoate cleavage enzyme
MPKVIVTVTPIGFISRKEVPTLAVTVDEIVDEVHKCYEAGASIVHLHARDPVSGLHIFDGKRMNEMCAQYIPEIRKRCDILINLSTGNGRSPYGPDGVLWGNPEADFQIFEERFKMKPEIASLNMGPLARRPARELPGRQVAKWGTISFNTVPWLRELITLMKKHNVKPELEIYDLGHVQVTKELADEGVLDYPLCCQFVMSIVIPSTPKNLITLYEALPDSSVWSACAMGREEFPTITQALLLGANGIRVGFEDNFRLSKTEIAKSNVDLVNKAVRIIKELGFEVASVDEARETLGIKK